MEKKSILIAIADDQELMRKVLTILLQRHGYTVIITASNGEDLVKCIAAGSVPHICILDLDMPVMDGFATISILKANWPQIKVLVFTIGDAKVNERKVLKSGVDAYADKLDGRKSLISALEKIVGSL